MEKFKIGTERGRWRENQNTHLYLLKTPVNAEHIVPPG